MACHAGNRFGRRSLIWVATLPQGRCCAWLPAGWSSALSSCCLSRRRNHGVPAAPALRPACRFQGSIALKAPMDLGDKRHFLGRSCRSDDGVGMISKCRAGPVGQGDGDTVECPPAEAAVRPAASSQRCRPRRAPGDGCVAPCAILGDRPAADNSAARSRVTVYSVCVSSDQPGAYAEGPARSESVAAAGLPFITPPGC